MGKWAATLVTLVALVQVQEALLEKAPVFDPNFATAEEQARPGLLLSVT